ncbi:MAG: 3'-5' exonuclease [Spirochaetota bacterium]
MKNTFTAIDFETASTGRTSICQVGLVRVVRGRIQRTYSSLVQPPGNSYRSDFIEIHGIDAAMTADARTFDRVWPEIQKYIEGELVVAHNISFDDGCLRHTLAHFGIAVPEYETACTYKIYDKGLADCCREYGIKLNHHEALSDATACAKLYLKYTRRNRSGR